MDESSVRPQRMFVSERRYLETALNAFANRFWLTDSDRNLLTLVCADSKDTALKENRFF